MCAQAVTSRLKSPVSSSSMMRNFRDSPMMPTEYIHFLILQQSVFKALWGTHHIWIPMNRTFHHDMIKILIQKINSKRMHRTRSQNFLTSSSVRQQLLPQGVQHRIPRRFHLRRTVIFRWVHIPQHSRGLVVNSNEVRVSWETAFEVARSFLHYNIVSISMTLYKIKWI